MQEWDARGHLSRASARAGEFGRGVLLGTFAIRHQRGLDVVFLLDGAASEFLIGMGAASDDFSSVLSIGVEKQRDAVHATASHTMSGRRRSVPARVVYRTPTVLVMEAAPLPLSDRPRALKCWSFVRQSDYEHFSDVTGFVSPALSDLSPVLIKTHPHGTGV